MAASTDSEPVETKNDFLRGAGSIRVRSSTNPRIFLKCTKRGIQIYGVGFAALWTGLAYMSVSAGAQIVFFWFLKIGTIASLFTWCSILVVYLHFRQALMLQGVNRNDFHFKSPFQPYTAWFALYYIALIIVFNGWEVLTKVNWSVEGFITAYVGIPIYFGWFVFWKILKRTSLVDPAEADIWSGKTALDAKIWPDTKPRNFLEKVWQWIV